MLTSGNKFIFHIIRANHVLEKVSLKHTLPTITAANVTSTNIEGTYFLKYVHISLIYKDQILNFYINLVTQATRYNVFLRPSLEVTKIDGVIPDDMSSDCITLIATTLYFKFCQKGTIASSCQDAHNL